MKTTCEDDDLGGCGYEWDHTIRVGENVCQECGAEIIDDENGDSL